jgi:hypothetical protein
MNLQESEKIMGIPEGIYYGQFDRVNELNTRLGSRQFPDIALQPNFDPRPLSTKYTFNPSYSKPTVRIQRNVDHVVELNFNPGSSRAPPQGFLNNIDKETILRNQVFALQHGADQAIYVPSSNSDLYKTTIVSTPGEPQPFPNLFSKSQFSATENPVEGTTIGKNVFFNHTRTQLRE